MTYKMEKNLKVLSYMRRITKAKDKDKFRLMSLLNKYCEYKLAKCKSKKRKRFYNQIYRFNIFNESQHRTYMCHKSIGNLLIKALGI
jgi:hypothetical protein